MADALAIACALNRQNEGLRLRAYADPGTGGEPWTIGWGNTCHLDGSPVRPGDVLSGVAEADALMEHALGIIRPKIVAMAKVPLEPCQEGALLSWAYNVGSGAAAHSTLIRDLARGDRLAAADQFLVWNRSNGRVMDGLVRRRKLERAVFLGLVDLAGSRPAAARENPTSATSTAAPARPALAPAAPPAPPGPTTADLNDQELASLSVTATPD